MMTFLIQRVNSRIAPQKKQYISKITIHRGYDRSESDIVITIYD